MGRIDFGNGRKWGAYALSEERRMAQDPKHPLHYRVWFAARGCLNRIGHAQFGPGELAKVLADRNGKPSSAQSVSRAISKARGLGLIGEDSNASCLVVERHAIQNEGAGNGICKVHGIDYGDPRTR